MHELYLAMIVHYASMYGINPYVAMNVARVESGLNPNVVGEAGEIGLFQLKSDSVKVSKKQLFNPEINIREGVKFLAKMKHECVHQDNINYLVCFNYGIENAKHVHYPHLWPYVKKVKKLMSDFKDGDKVVVEGMYNFTLDGFGIYKGLSLDPHFKGYLRVENEFGHVMRVEPKRVKKVEE